MRSHEQLYYNGDIITMDDAQPAAEAVAVKDGTIIAVGDVPHCTRFLNKGYEAIDLRRSALAPGFIDTHLHPVMMIYFELNVNLFGAASMEEVRQRLKNAAREKDASMWIVGLNFDEQMFATPVLPNRHDIDAACPDRPAIIVKHDGHMIIANTKAIAAAGITNAVQDPAGGKIDREAGGHPSGPFRENAMPLILSAMPLPDQQSLVDASISAFNRLLSYGITSAGVVLQTDENGHAGAIGAFDVPVLQMLLDSVPISLYGIIAAADITTVTSLFASPLHARDAHPSRRIGAVKMFADGTFASCTAYMREPLTDHPESTGFMTTTEDELYKRMGMAHNANLQVCIHAIGDRANRVCIDLYDRLLREYPRRNHRHRLEHASILDAAMIEDIRRLGIVISAQPMFIHSEKNWLYARFGRERAKNIYPFRSIVDAGVKLAGASDTPVESADVLHALQCCVTREGFETQECISAAQALKMFTIDAAYAQFEESEKGSITPGKRADMVVLDRNPLRIEPEEIAEINVMKTIIGGRVKYERA